MGAVGSKSPLERRNTVLRRSQRKSIHGIKSKADKIIKDIKKYKGIEEDSAYIDLKARIETAERELRNHVKNLQPQTRAIYNETLKKTEGLHTLLNNKLKENQEKVKEKVEKEKEKQTENKETKEAEGDDDVFVEEINEEEKKDEERRKTVELKVIHVEPIEASPQINKRFSAMKIGVPVMPGSMMESLNRKSHELIVKAEAKIGKIRKEIETLEEEISTFVGKRNGRHYNRIKSQLDGYSSDLKSISSNDEAISEQVKMCSNYISSCLSFLDEKAVDEGGDGDDDDDYDEVEENDMTNTTDVNSNNVIDNNLSPRSMRTTYI